MLTLLALRACRFSQACIRSHDREVIFQSMLDRK